MVDKTKKIHNDLIRAENYILNSKLDNGQKEVLKRYFKALNIGIGCKSVSVYTIRNVIHTLIKFGEYVNKNFIDCSKENLIDYISYIKSLGRMESTIGLHRIYLRQFYIWLYRENNLCTEEEIPNIVKWMKGFKSRKNIDMTKLWEPLEVKKLIEVSDNDRDKALISGLYESACRRSEWLGIKIKDVKFDEFGCKVFVSGKTGSRNVYLIDSTPYMHKWLENHPFKNDKESYFFISLASNYYGRQLSISNIGDRMKTLAKRANIDKEVYPHLFRHSRLTWLAQKEGLNERDLKIIAGWSETSDMPNTYLHYGEDEVANKLKKIKGLYTQEESEKEIQNRKALEPKICPRCNKKQDSTALYCNCGMVLDVKESMRIDDLKQNAIDQAMEEFMKIVQDPLRMRKFLEFKKNQYET